MKEFDFDKHIDHLKDIVESIELNKVTILTGSNASGKSLVRKLLPSVINKSLGKDLTNRSVSSISMERRTALHGDLGGLGFMLRDFSDKPTGLETFRFISGIFQDLSEAPEDKNLRNKKFIVLDEPELGASREVQRAFSKYISGLYDKIHNPNLCHGLLVITHSEELVRTLKHDRFINIQGLSEESWLSRDLEEIDLQELSDFADNLYRAIEARLKNNKEK